MQELTSLMPVVGSIGAALIAALATYVVTVLAKENKTSEFRQAWIESLRNDVSEMLGEFNVLEGVYDATVDRSLDAKAGQKQADEFWKTHHKEYAKIDLLCNRIVLRLNPVEHQGLIEKIRNLEGSVGKGQKSSAAMSKDIVVEFSRVLKVEWNRVKDGETVFRRMKSRAIIALVLGGLSLIGAVVASFLVNFF